MVVAGNSDSWFSLKTYQVSSTRISLSVSTRQDLGRILRGVGHILGTDLQRRHNVDANYGRSGKNP